MVETGRFKGTDRALPMCPICDSYDTEDEIHFTGTCVAIEEASAMLVHDLNIPKPETTDARMKLLKSILLKDNLKVSSRHLQAIFEERKHLMASGNCCQSGS